MGLEEWDGGCGVDASGLWLGPWAGFYENGDEPRGSMGGSNFLTISLSFSF